MKATEAPLQSKPSVKSNDLNIVIEHNIPLPPRQNRGEVTETLRAMKVGDSAVIPKDKAPSWRAVTTHSSIKIATRAVSQTECRVWRIA